MDVRSPLFQNIALIVAGVLFLNPIVATAAQLAVDQSAGGSTAVTQAQNGVPMVNIATPNGSGLSHNKFTDYNVGQQGLILNNSAQNLVQTQLGGYVVGNPNLKNGAAGLILNEVTGGNASQLKGYTEVAGRSAAVIVANPHGITCDGCGFINTPRVTLSTGTPIIENGRLQRFDVDGGQIAIEGAGLNAGNLDQFDLITRSAQINAELHAKKLNIITGRNEVDAATLAATAKGDDGSSKPMLAIDSSALGGMYAGAIRLVGTEQGVGVKLAGDMAASAGDIQIDANGKLSLNRVAASGDVALKASTIDLNADTYAGRNATIEAQQVEVRESLAAGQRLTVQAGQLNNTGTIEAGVRANGSVNSAGHLQLDGGEVRNAGQMTSHGSMATDLQALDNQGGKIATAGSATLKAEQLDNREGEIVAQGNLTLDAAKLDNRAGSALAGQALAIEAEAVDNRAGTLAAGGAIEARVTNALNNNGGLVEAGGRLDVEADSLSNVDGRLRALGSGGESRFAIGTRLNNDEGVLEVGSATLTFETESLSNQGGVVRHLGSGGLGLDMQLLGQAGGEFITNSAVSLSAEEWVNRSLLQAASIELDVQRLTQTATGGLLSVGGLAVQADSWTNDGRIETEGDLSLTLSGSYAGNGKLLAQGNLSLSADSSDLGSDAELRSAGGMHIDIGAGLSNAGKITSVNDLSINAANVNNQGTLGSANKLRVESNSLRNEQGFMFSGLDMILLSDKFHNLGGDIYSAGQLDIARDLQGQASSFFSNLSGSIESIGDLRLSADSITNARTVLDIISHKAAARMTYAGCYDCSGKRNANYVLEEIDRTEVTNASASASLLSGGNMLVQGRDFLNSSSLIAASGDLSITVQEFSNKGATLGEYRVQRFLNSHRTNNINAVFDYVDAFNARNWPQGGGNISAEINSFLQEYIYEHYLLGAPVFTPEATVDYAGILQAGKTITINSTNNLAQSEVRPSLDYVSGGLRLGDTSTGSSIATTVTLNPQLPPDLQQKAVDPLLLPGFSLPTGQNGLFSLSNDPGHRYLIETNPAFANLGNFLNSDYMLGLLGFDPDEMQRRLGDGFYEQRLVREAVRARTGQRYLAGLDSDEAQFKYLMNNAIASKEALNLSVGVALSAEQVAALTHDIVWMEEREVQGQKVLVPVLYLAQAEGRLAPSGALIQGRDVTLISGGDLNNSGTLRATQNLSLTAQQNIANSGLMHAGERLSLLAGDSIRNTQGGILKGQNVSLVAVTGDVVNERTVSTHHSTTRHTDRQQSFVDSAARIEAGNDLLVSAGKDIRNIGGAISAGGDASLQAGNDLILGSAEAENRQNRWDRKGHSYQTDITQYSSDVQVGGDLTAVAGRDLLVVGSTVKAGGDIGLGAGGDMTIASAANESSSDYYRKSGGKRVIAQEHHVKQVASVIEAGGNLDMRTDGNLVLVASQLKAGNEAYLYAGEQLALLAAQNSDYSLYDKKKKGGWGSKETQRDEVTTVRNVGSSITTGGDLILVSEGDQLYQKARLESGNDLILDSGGSITFEAVKDLDQESHEKSSNSWAWTSAKGKGSTDETLYQSQLIAKGDLVIQAVDGLRIDVKEVNQQSVSQTIDAMVKTDPELAWLKEMEQRGDVDWRQVKEIHDSFKYSHSGLGAGAQLILAIAMAVIMGPAGLGLTGAQGAVAASVATTATNSAISNKGNLSAVFKDVTSKDAIKGYVVSGVTAGVGAKMGYSPTDLGLDWKSVGQVAAKTAVDAGVKTAVYGGSLKSNLAEAAIGNAVIVAGAIGADAIGGLELKSGSLEKIVLHAALGGLLAEASGGDFRTGALSAGASEALVGLLAEKLLPQGVDRTSPEYQQGMHNLVAASQIIGVLAAGLTGGDVQAAAAVAANATANNYLRHQDVEAMVNALEGCDLRGDCQQIRDDFLRISDANRARLAQCEQNGNCEAIKAEIAEGKAALDKLQGYALAVAEADFNTRQWQDGNSVQTILNGQANRSAESAAERSQRQEAEKLVEIARDPEGLKQLTEMRAQAAYRADLEQKLLADAEVQRLAQQSAADLAAYLDQLMPGWRTHREQSLDFVDGVKQGGVLLADVVSPDAWDLLGPSAKAAKLAGIFAGVGKVSGKVSADLVESAAKLNNLLAGKTPSSAELAPFTKAAERQLAEEIKLANQTLAKKPVAAGGGPKATGTAGEVAGTGARNPLLDDAIPRGGDRLVVNQGPVPTCGHNSCGMVLNTLGKEVDVGTLIQKLPPSEKGIFAQDVASLMKSEGVPASAFGSRNVSDLARYTSNGTPVVVRVVDKTTGSGFSHFVVVDGVTTRNGISVVAIRDPHGKQYFSPVSTFERNFSGEVVVPRSVLK